MAQPSGIFTAPAVTQVLSAPVTNLTGNLVSLGPLRRDWLPIYQHWLNDFEMLKLVDRQFKPHSTEWITNWYERHATGQTDSLIFTIIENASSRPVGNIALQDLDYRNRTAELGIYIGDTASRGQGYGSEATSLIVNFAFRVLGLQNIMLRVYEYNEPAIRVYQKAGFREFGRRHQGQFMDGRFWDVILMECLPPAIRHQLSI
jgi:RimJ/RimL family protein N-acetyltransferase